MRIYLLCIFFIAGLSVKSLYGQEEIPSKTMKIFLKAEHHYHHFAYYDAIDYYKRFLALKKGDRESMLKIADSYYKVRDYDQTLVWYDSAVLIGDLPVEHEFQYADVLMSHGMNGKAVIWLRKYVKSHPNDKRAHEKLNGLENINQFFKDYRQYTISSFPANSGYSEFSPVYYRDGLIFVSSREEAKQKKDLDVRSYRSYLNLYYVSLKDSAITEAEKFNGINNRFHEGPLTLYDSGRKMIFTRNDFVKIKRSVGGSNTVHFQLFQTENIRDGEWSNPKLLSIHDKQYSMGHPSVSKDGKTLFFASNMPGGIGGSDIYKSVWSNNSWGKPENLGRDINTEGNEMFPHTVNDSILFFSSDGLRGLGGLDIFKVNLNKLSSVHNLGYPINSNKDDFGVLLNTNVSGGYLSSNREGGIGGDDIYKFTIRTSPIEDRVLVANVFKESDESRLSYAKVKIISFTEPDADVIANEKGEAIFSLPAGAVFVAIGNKDDYTGMFTGTVKNDADSAGVIYPIPCVTDNEKSLPVAGRITNKKGELLADAVVTVTDKSTGEKVPVQFTDGVLSFYGEKGKEYDITVEHQDYQTGSKKITIPQGTNDAEKISIALENKPVPFLLTARVFKASDNSSLGSAQVRIISFTEPDLELVADSAGVINFSLPDSTAFVIIGNKNEYTGMYSGEAANSENKVVSIFPIPANTDHANELPVVGRITNKKGELLENAVVTVTDKSTGEKVPVQFKNGLLSFYGKKGTEYDIIVEHQDYQTALEKITIPQGDNDVEKISITLENKLKASLMVHVFKEADQSSLGSAHVSIISFTEPDQEFIANDEGKLDFSLPDSTVFVIIGSKGKYSGMYAGVVENGIPIICPVPANANHVNELPIVARITNKKGESLDEASVTVTNKSTGEKIPVHFKNGILTFYGKKGEDYTIAIEHKDYMPASEHVSIPQNSDGVNKISITLEEKAKEPSSYQIAVRVFKESDGSALEGAIVKVINFITPDLELTADHEGIVDFTLPEGAAYLVVGSKDGYTGMHSGLAEKGMEKASITHPVPANDDPSKQLIILGLIKDENGKPMINATVQVINKANGQSIPAKIENGILSFYGKSSSDYSIEVSADGYESQTKDLSIDANESTVKPLDFILPTLRRKFSESSTLIVFKNVETAKFYLTSDESHHQIVERDGFLYLKNSHETKSIGKGSVAGMLTDPVGFIQEHGLPSDRVVKIENIYFAYNKAVLDKGDKLELVKVKNLLQRYTFLRLSISTHADARGDDTYNLDLSKKRAKVIRTYLIRQGIKQQFVNAQAYGESALLVPCATSDCSETDHRKNRRAEFDLTGTANVVPKVLSKPKTIAKQKKNPDKYTELLSKYGDEKRQGLIFKVSVGAYRLNHNLTFSELKDLGDIEKKLVNGIMFYYLSGFETLRKAEDARQIIIQRGLADAYIDIFNNDKKISFSRFISIVPKTVEEP